jgi:hypothetical protein
MLMKSFIWLVAARRASAAEGFKYGCTADPRDTWEPLKFTRFAVPNSATIWLLKPATTAVLQPPPDTAEATVQAETSWETSRAVTHPRRKRDIFRLM